MLGLMFPESWTCLIAAARGYIYIYIKEHTGSGASGALLLLHGGPSQF